MATERVLPALPLRTDPARTLVPVLLLPGLLLATAHAPEALLALGPLVLGAWVLSRRERYRLDHCRVRLLGPALRLEYGGRVLEALDLRWARRRVTEGGDVVLSEGRASCVMLGPNPGGDPVMLPTDDNLQLGVWHVVRLEEGDMATLRLVLDEVPQRPAPTPDRPLELIEALGSVGRWGPRAEALLLRHLQRTPGESGGAWRGDGVMQALLDVASRADAAGAAARRVLEQVAQGDPAASR